ncbi:MAG: AAA domain-containing protein, partial [Xanthobacteraceae bacterium]
QLVALSRHEKAANAYRTLSVSQQSLIKPSSIDNLVATLGLQLTHYREILRIDPDRRLAAVNLPIGEIARLTHLKLRQAQIVQLLATLPSHDRINAFVTQGGDLEELKAAVTWVSRVRALKLPRDLPARILTKGGAEIAKRIYQIGQNSKEAITVIDEGIRRIRTHFNIELLAPIDPDPLLEQLAKLISHRSQLAQFLGLCAQRKIIDGMGLGPYLREVESIRLSPDKIPAALATLLAHSRAEEVQKAHPQISQLNGAILDARRKAFVDRDRRKITNDRAAVRELLLPAQLHPGNNTGPRKTWTEMALIRNELQKQQRFIPVRTLFRRSRKSLQALMPCFMMSPLSLAKFLPIGAMKFDLVVIDEASQMRPEDSLGGLLRAKQVVVVGDQKQLPPTDFFNRTDGASSTVEDEDEYDDVDDESILEACQKAFRQVRRLKWHYRSRCESLIAFSNREFYENGLITFPNPRPGSFSIDLIRVKGTYQGRRNVPEALQIAEEAIAFMRHYAVCDEDHLPTIGIVAINIEQRDLIREELNRLSAGDDLVEEFQSKAEKKGEEIFVKNLENVQGDERDFILISMTYGYEPNLNLLKQRFGPINGKQGHRRLNVLFSRARQRIGLFVSFGSADVRPTEKSHQGVHVLRRYLEYVEGRGRAPIESVGTEVDSDFESAVADRLRAVGYTVEYQVGVSGFRIDLGVRNPASPETFLAGIECDGAQYHSSKSARDRDRLREEILTELGWKILRVWSTDWFLDPDEEVRKLILKLEKLRNASQEQRQPAKYSFKVTPQDDFEVTPQDESVPATSSIESSGTITDDADTPTINQPSQDPTGPSQTPPTNGIRLTGELPTNVLQPAPIFLADLPQQLREFRETVIAKEMADWEPQRSILREGMIETFTTMRLKDPGDWFKRVPQYQRQNTNPIEKQKYLDRICEIVQSVENRSGADEIGGSA